MPGWHNGRTFRLVYLLRNTITNLTTQDNQVECFRTAAAHPEPGGLSVIENYIPELQRLPPGETLHQFARTQIAVSYHYWTIDGDFRMFSSRHRYVWPAELDLMARFAGMTLRGRWGDWHRAPFTAASRSHVSVWEKPA